MGFSVPAISCMLSLPSNTSLFYLKMINDVAGNVHQPAAAPLHRCNELCRPCVTGQSAVLRAERPRDVYCASCRRPGHSGRPLLGYLGLVLEGTEGTEHEIILYPTGQQQAVAVSKLITNYPQIL